MSKLVATEDFRRMLRMEEEEEKQKQQLAASPAGFVQKVIVQFF